MVLSVGDAQVPDLLSEQTPAPVVSLGPARPEKPLWRPWARRAAARL
jgi:hypothetical protein